MMEPLHTARPRWLQVAWIVLSAGLAFVCYGYVFPHENLNIEIPPILAMLDPGLYPRDFFVQEMLRFTPRTYYKHLVASLATLGMGVDGAYFVLYLVAVTAFGAGLFKLGEAAGGHTLAGVLLVWWGLTAAAGSVGDNPLFRNGPIPMTLAGPLSVWGLYAVWRRAWIPAYACFGGACLLQFLVGLLPAVLVAPLLAADVLRGRRWLTGLGAGLALGLGAGAVYVPMVLQGTTGTDLLSNEAFVRIYGVIRHPHHIVPSAWPLQTWIDLVGLHLGGLFLLKRARAAAVVQWGVRAAVSVMALALLATYLFVEVWPLAVVAKLQLARTTPFSSLIVWVGLLTVLGQALRHRHVLIVALLAVVPVSSQPGLLLVAVAAAYPLLRTISTDLDPRGQGWVGGVAALGLYNWPLFGLAQDWMQAVAWGPLLLGALLVPWLGTRARTALVPALVLGAAALLLLPRWYAEARHALPPHVFADDTGSASLKAVARQFQAQSPREALVLVPPSAFSFRLWSQRSVVADVKAFPYTDAGIRTWYNRMRGLSGPPEAAPWFDRTANYAADDPATVQALACLAGADHILVRGGRHAPEGTALVQAGPWAVYALPPTACAQAALDHE